MKTIIGFTGRAGSGKTTAAVHLATKYGFQRVRFAGPLKAMLHAIGLNHDHTDGDLKEQPCEMLCGKTPRHAMQTLGQEWGRQLLGEDFWIRAWQVAVENAKSDFIVVEDVRYENEANAIHAMGGTVCRVTRRGTSAVEHDSENGMFPVDWSFINNGTEEHFRDALTGLLGPGIRRARHAGLPPMQVQNDRLIGLSPDMLRVMREAGE